MKSIFSLLAGLLALVLVPVAQAEMPRMELTAGMYRIDTEVAADQQNRMLGLMHRKSMPQHHGMLFVFPQANTHCMWMRNTLLPLSVAFIDDNGVVINIEDMQPQTEDSHCAKRPARFALEMNLGWFRERGIKSGSKIGGIERAPQPR
ncbi:DUF192 domain-containing protein [Dechloromonas sp. ZY10]|uniref:DUF192 domain-containing protein n=1 Tax=Dechloromonas aquae TaxID=2664436 RepID=UPI0035287CD2